MIYTASDNCVRKLENLESFRATVYFDGGGLATIGYGRRCAPNEPPTTPEREKAWLELRLAAICQWLDVNMPGLMQHHVDSLCLFLYSIGVHGFETCDTYKLLKAHEPAAFAHWLSWIKDAKGKVEAGLVARRHYEVDLFIFGTY